jgi:hypothetical protein
MADLREPGRKEKEKLKSLVFWVITRRRVVIIYRSFGTTYRSHLQGSRFPNLKSRTNCWDKNIWNMLMVSGRLARASATCHDGAQCCQRNITLSVLFNDAVSSHSVGDRCMNDYGTLVELY